MWPVSQRGTEDAALTEADLRRWQLPDMFVIYSYNCAKHIVSGTMPLRRGHVERDVITDAEVRP